MEITKPIYKVYNDKYVAAVIQGMFELGQWIISVPKERLKTLKIARVDTTDTYPVKFIEYEFGDRREFLCTEKPEETIRNLKNWGRNVLATYTVTEDFLGDPKRPGEDYMGILHHVHEMGPDDE